MTLSRKGRPIEALPVANNTLNSSDFSFELVVEARLPVEFFEHKLMCFFLGESWCGVVRLLFARFWQLTVT